MLPIAVDYRVLEYNRVPAATSTNTTADRELGQIDLMHGIFNFGGPSALLGPEGVAVDSSGHVYVTDYGNNRVLGWHNAAALTNGAAADLVIGQPDFYTNVYEGTGAGTFSGPSGIAVDPSSGNLYIADSNDARVLEFNQPFAGFTGSPITGLSASLVFGQGGSFTANYCNNLASATADTLCYPQAVAFDDSGNLYVSDYINNRVLEYYAPFTGGSHSGTPGYSGDTTADVVFGQGGLFTTNTCSNGGVSADSLCEPEGLALDASSNLYVADVNPSRVLEYLAPFTGGTHTGTPGYSGDTTADLVFGQDGSFTTSSCNGGTDAGDVNGLGPDSLCYPTGVALDAFGNLYAIDQGNNRALDYMALFTGGSHSGTPGYSGDTTADQVFGTCGSFTGSSCSGISADSLDFPTGAAVDTGNNLYVADTSDNRVLEYYNPLSLPTQTATPTDCDINIGDTTNRNRDGDQDRDGDCDINRRHADRHGDGDQDRDGNGDGDINRRHADRDCDRDGDQDCDGDRDGDVDRIGNANGDRDGDSDGDCRRQRRLRLRRQRRLRHQPDRRHRRLLRPRRRLRLRRRLRHQPDRRHRRHATATATATKTATATATATSTGGTPTATATATATKTATATATSTGIGDTDGDCDGHQDCDGNVDRDGDQDCDGDGDRDEQPQPRQQPRREPQRQRRLQQRRRPQLRRQLRPRDRDSATDRNGTATPTATATATAAPTPVGPLSVSPPFVFFEGTLGGISTSQTVTLTPQTPVGMTEKTSDRSEGHPGIWTLTRAGGAASP